MIASLAERAMHADPPVPVMIVTGDRDVFQLIDERRAREGDGDRARDHRDEDLRPPGGGRPLRHPAGADPRLLRAEGRHLRQHPRHPRDRRQDRQRAAAVASARSRTCSRNVEAGQRTQAQSRTSSSTPRTRASRKQLATVQRDLEVDVDIVRRGRPRARPLARARGVPRVRAARPAAAPGGGARRPRRGGAGAVGRGDADRPRASGLAGRRSPRWARPTASCASSLRGLEPPEGELFAEGPPWRFAVAAGGEVIGRATATGPRRSWRPAPGGRSSRTTRRRSGSFRARLAHDTLLGAYLLEPARRGYPFAELCEERGLASDLEDPLAGERGAARGARRLAARADRRARPGGADAARSSCRSCPCCASMELLGVRLNLERLAEITTRVRDEIDGLEREIFALAGEEFTIGSPQQLGEILFERLGPVAQAARQDRLLDRRARAAGDPLRARDRPEDRALARALDADQDLPRRAARAWSTTSSRIHTTFLQAVAQTGRLSSTNPNMQNVPIRTPLGREIRGCFEAEPGAVLISADYSQIELRVLAHAAERGRADGDLHARRGRAHGDRLARVRRLGRARSTRACARRPR